MRNPLFIVLISFFGVGCSSLNNPASIVGSSWGAVAINAKDSVITTEADRPSITFTTDTEFAGHTTCNSISGSYTVGDKGKLKLNTEATTMAMCPDVTFEADFIQALDRTDFYAITGDTLTLKDIDGKFTVKFAKKNT